MLSKLLKSRRKPSATAPHVPAGVRVYAVGDVHGRLDLLDDLIARIDRDDVAREPADTTIIFLGDLIDRGPASCAVIDRLGDLARSRGNLRFLTGNHEEIFLAAIAGGEKAVRLFCRIGGRETLLSYGVDAAEYERLDYAEVADRLRHVVPPEHVAFLSSFEDSIEIGDYLFVHAGIRPGVALAEQRTADLRWIREPFLGFRERMEKLVVHGHTMSAEVERRPHRIGIDTGAYESGRLTALGLDGAESWLVQT